MMLGPSGKADYFLYYDSNGLGDWWQSATTFNIKFGRVVI